MFWFPGLSNSKGQHWVAWIMLSPNHCEFFDSYGDSYEDYRHLMPPAITIVRENCVQLQSEISHVCGEYCVMFVTERSRGISYEDFLDAFKFDTAYNDWLVTTFVNNKARFHPYKNYDGYSDRVMGCGRKCDFINN